MWDYHKFVLTLLKHKVPIMPRYHGNLQVLKKKKEQVRFLVKKEPDVI